MKRVFYLGLAVVFALMSCAGGVGGEKLDETQKGIAVRGITESIDSLDSFSESVIAGSRVTLVNETKPLNDAGSTLHVKGSATCGAKATVKVTMDAKLIDWVQNDIEVVLDPAKPDLETRCTSTLNGNLKLEYTQELGLTTGEAKVKFLFQNTDAKGVKMKLVDGNGNVVFEKPVFIRLEMTYSIKANAAGDDISSNVKVSCKVNGEKYESDFLNKWTF